jgi:CDP-4-dehydro-6-deoxyglucose reductase
LNTIKTLSGKKFFQDDSQSILSSAEKNNIFLPYSCRTGRCSSCKCKLISGETGINSNELGLSDKEKKDGWILSCVRFAQSDIVIDVEDFGDIKIPKANVYPCKISKINSLTHDVVQVILRFPPNIDFSFIPGQYVDIIGPNNIKRSYSIANNFQNNLIELHVKNVPGGLLSDYWFNKAKNGDLLRMYGPQGTFFIRDNIPKKIIFLATGTGIAPVLSIIEGLKSSKLNLKKQVSIFWGVRFNEDLYINKFEHLLNECNFFPVLSKPNKEWEGLQGYVQNALIAKNYNLKDASVYACGSDSMIKSAEETLNKKGLEMVNFYSDAFLPSSPQKVSV